MSDSSRLATLAFGKKPVGMQLTFFQLTNVQIAEIDSVLNDDIIDSAYDSAISYAEAVAGLRKKQIAWSIVRLYYSAFYSLRTIMLLNKVVPFNFKSEYLIDLKANMFLHGGKSSHRWNWNAFAKLGSLKGHWPYSGDSQNAYDQLREYREDVSYRYSFPDPKLHQCLITSESDIARRIRIYRDDSKFFYTYLIDHLVVSYPTKLIYFVDQEVSNMRLAISSERAKHLRSVWPIPDRCPLT